MKSIKRNVKKCKKVFTKNESNNIMRKKYNPLKANKCEREGLFMKETKDVILDEIVKELSKKYNKREQVVKVLLDKCKIFSYNIKESKEIIINFFNI